MWTQEQAIELCRLVEIIAPDFGCHVALTGGLLYKFGPRKDCDLLFYRIRDREEVDVLGLFRALAGLGIERITVEEVWCIKATYRGKPIDCFFPDAEEGDYPPASADGPDRQTGPIDVVSVVDTDGIEF